MLRKTLFALAVVASVAFVSGTAFAADPTLHEVYQAAEAGNYREAQTMMDQVLRDHPNSAKAHFVEAELLAKQGRLASAQTELATAERLDPGLSFASPRAVQELKARLASSPGLGQPSARLLPSATGGGFPWGALLVVLGLVAVIAFAVSRLRQRSTDAVQRAGLPTSYGGGAGSAQPYGAGGVGPVTPTGGMGSGILGGLATGAAVGAGVVAGEALMHRVLDGHRSEDPVPGSRDVPPESSQPQYDMGGDDFGVSDGSWDDSSGGGGDDWT
jgi:uncharacterized protein